MYAAVKPQDALRRYADLCANSKFILCPRGIGTSSLRLFETLQAGRVPVIVSDDWVPPRGPDWPRFAVFVAEDRIADIPAVLEAEEEHWAQKSALARQAWEDFFAPDTLFHYFISSLVALDRTPALTWRAKAAHFGALSQYALRKEAKKHLRPLLGLFK
jgi:hypothetical protein